MDMIPETLVEDFLRNFIALVVNEHPVCELAVPAEGVSAKRNTVLTAEVCDLVSVFPVPLAFTRLERNHLHVVFSCDAVEVLLDQSDLVRILDISDVYSNTHCEVILIGILVTCRIFNRPSPRESLGEKRTCTYSKCEDNGRNSFHVISIK